MRSLSLSGRLSGPLSRALFVAVATTALTATLAVTTPAYARTSHRALNDTRPAVAGVVEVDFPIQFFGVIADLPPGTLGLPDQGRSPYGQARFRVQGVWTPWQDLDQDGAQAPGQFTGALVSVADAEAYQVRRLPVAGHRWRAAAINTTDGPTITVDTAPAGAATAAPPCRSRADWGADESISGWAKGDVKAFSPVQVLTVHHTAGSNDLTQNYAATVRGIYSYHVTSNGWSDIGYQYLISGTGIVFEGRNSGHTSRSCLTGGGDGSDFAHQTTTDYLVTGAHVANYNTGNLGVALLGCYEATSACSGETTPPAAAVNSLEDLLAAQATRHGLNPQGTVRYVNPSTGVTKDVPTISGHRTWASTACPGGRLFNQLPTIRSVTASRMTAPATAPGQPGSFTATPSSGTVSLAWGVPSDGGAPISRYEVFRGTSTPVSTATTPVYSGTATSTTNTPATGTYYYAVRACNSVGCGATATAGPVAVVAATAITSASCSGATCTFAGTGPSSLSWAFGNGATATGTPVSTTYASATSFTVVLTSGGTTASRLVTCSQVKSKLRCTT